jgi:CheY-like chemotaxis protein
VVSTLEALVAAPETFRADLEPRVALFNAFVKIWSLLPVNRETEKDGGGAMATADRRLETLTPLPRQALLLSAIESFSAADIGHILEVSEEDARGLVARAGSEIAEQIAAKVLIIEDEPLIALDLENIVGDIGHGVIGIATTRQEAADLARKSNPGIILADIQLADGSSGIDAVNDILTDIDVPVVFITAYPERLLTGERPEPAFLITKPFKHEMVKAVVSQALFFDVRAGLKRGAAA